jgi:hypothetical protein
MQQVKVKLVSFSGVSLVAVAIDPSAPFGDEMSVVALKKPSNPAIRNLTIRYRTSEISQHFSCWW